MLITKHNRVNYFFFICFLLPIFTSILTMLFMHNKQLHAKYTKVSIKLFIVTFKHQFDNQHALALFSIILVPSILIFLFIHHFYYVEFDIKPFSKHLRGVKRTLFTLCTT